MNNPVQWIDLLGLAHTSGKWKDCGKGCRIRIDGDAVGDGRHLHWECKMDGCNGEFEVCPMVRITHQHQIALRNVQKIWFRARTK